MTRWIGEPGASTNPKVVRGFGTEYRCTVCLRTGIDPTVQPMPGSVSGEGFRLAAEANAVA